MIAAVMFQARKADGPDMSDKPVHPRSGTEASSREIIVYVGLGGDRNPRAVLGAELLGRHLAGVLALSVRCVGVKAAPICAGYEAELDAARPDLLMLRETVRFALAGGPIIVCLPRCAAALATLPAVAAAHSDACLVWFDAHGDANVPEHTTSGYLGGLVITGAAGLWNTGLGEGLSLAQIVLVGTRDLDPFEKALVDSGALKLVAPGPSLAMRLRDAIAGRPCYVHLDCDVLEPGLLPTEYQVPGGLSFAELQDACRVVSEQKLVGLEIAEFEATWSDGSPGIPDLFVRAIAPLLAAFKTSKTQINTADGPYGR